MKIKILQVGKNKDQHLAALCSEFVKRISAFANVEIITVDEQKVSATFKPEKARELEGREILKATKGEANILLLDEHGEEYNSIKFAGFLEKFGDGGESVCFIIGGAFGVSKEVKAKAKKILSFSKMTFTHQMIRVFLLEQTYRAFCIMRGKEYHHE